MWVAFTRAQGHGRKAGAQKSVCVGLVHGEGGYYVCSTSIFSVRNLRFWIPQNILTRFNTKFRDFTLQISGRYGSYLLLQVVVQKPYLACLLGSARCNSRLWALITHEYVHFEPLGYFWEYYQDISSPCERGYLKINMHFSHQRTLGQRRSAPRRSCLRISPAYRRGSSNRERCMG